MVIICLQHLPPSYHGSDHTRFLSHLNIDSALPIPSKHSTSLSGLASWRAGLHRFSQSKKWLEGRTWCPLELGLWRRSRRDNFELLPGNVDEGHFDNRNHEDLRSGRLRRPLPLVRRGGNAALWRQRSRSEALVLCPTFF
jgi:hypothetical protein